MNIKKIDILGVPANIVDFDTTIQYIEDVINNKAKGKYIVAQNAEKIMMARRDPVVMEILKKACLLIPDGVGVGLGCKILHGKSVPRVTGFGLFNTTIRLAAENQYSIFMMGARKEVVVAAKNILQKNYPGLNITGYHHGYFANDEDIVDIINSCKPDILYVAMGSPKQEKWIYSNINDLNAKICLGVGGSFDVIAGKVKLAPPFFRRSGLEWLYRLIVEPKRFKRQMVLPAYVFLLLAAKIRLINKRRND